MLNVEGFEPIRILFLHRTVFVLESGARKNHGAYESPVIILSPQCCLGVKAGWRVVEVAPQSCIRVPYPSFSCLAARFFFVSGLSSHRCSRLARRLARKVRKLPPDGSC